MQPDIIGSWSEIKLQILKDYAKAYSIILSKQPGLKHVYIDAFSGAGVHISRYSNEEIPGSPANALSVEPPFYHYYFIDKDKDKIRELALFCGDREDVTLEIGDSNDLLLRKVFPEARFGDFMRGLCFLDPYGLDVDWSVVATAGKMRSIELLINFLLYDMNRNVLWRKNPTGQSQKQLQRMERFWGDESWRGIIYDTTGDLFEHPEKVPAANTRIAEAYCRRVREVAGFQCVTKPKPMIKDLGRVIYYLVFASPNETGFKIAKHVFANYG